MAKCRNRRTAEATVFVNTKGSDNWTHYWYERDLKPGTPLITYGQDGFLPQGRGFQVFESTVAKGRHIGSTTSTRRHRR